MYKRARVHLSSDLRRSSAPLEDRVANFFKARRGTDDEVLRAAALSGAFEHLRRKRKDYPVHVPKPLQSFIPVPINEITPLLKEARRRTHHQAPAFDSIRAGLDRQMEACGHRQHERFCSECPRRKGSNHKQLGVTDTDIEFDPSTFVTGVTVLSVFEDVSWFDARAIATLADPPNWDNAAPTFFKETASVLRDRSTGGFIGSAPDDSEKYQLRERVEWDWSPSVAGGIINVLDITKVASRESAGTFAARVIGKLRSQKRGLSPYTGFESPKTLIDYRYKLNRCIQSKLVASWEPGGLDIDEGTYRAVWSPKRGKSGTLVLEAVKRIRYSSEADVVPGLSTLLNLLAPAVTSMLMNHLTFDGPCGFIAYRAEREAQKREAHRGNSRRRNS
jgi:hypothetical protein